MQRYDAAEHISVGTGEDLSIRELAQIVKSAIIPQPRPGGYSTC